MGRHEGMIPKGRGLDKNYPGLLASFGALFPFVDFSRSLQQLIAIGKILSDQTCHPTLVDPMMAIFSKYSTVLEADGSPMLVKTALQLINRFLAEDDFDADTQFCLHWFDQCGWDVGKFGDADTLARARGTSVEGGKQSGVIFSAGGSVRLHRWIDYPDDWDPSKDLRLPIWEVLHFLIRALKQGGESQAGRLLSEPNIQSSRSLCESASDGGCPRSKYLSCEASST